MSKVSVHLKTITNIDLSNNRAPNTWRETDRTERSRQLKKIVGDFKFHFHNRQEDQQDQQENWRLG